VNHEKASPESSGWLNLCATYDRIMFDGFYSSK
jgi:hypothetical protein